MSLKGLGERAIGSGVSAEGTPACDLEYDDFASSHGNVDDHFVSEHGRRITVSLPRSTLVTPRSCYDGYVPSKDRGELVDEKVALSTLMLSQRGKDTAHASGFIEFNLDDFCIYVDSASYPDEMRSLHNLATKSAHDNFYFDGTLSMGELRFFVKRVKFSKLPIGNYGRSTPTVGGEIWIQSSLNAAREVYYRLGKPAFEYARFHRPFLWVADLAKHVIDFSESSISQGRHVAISSFRDAFGPWLWQAHGQHPSFEIWYAQHASHDFRTSVVANMDYIYKEMFSVLGAPLTQSLQLFREIRDFRQHKPSCFPPPEGRVPPTTVTPYVQECFGHTKFGHLLQLAGPDQYRQGPAATTDGIGNPQPSVSAPVAEGLSRLISVGDVISTYRDGESTGTKWKRESAVGALEDDRWFGLVQKVHESKQGHRSFDVIWLYRPVDTPCGRMKYPWSKELFLSDHCSCEEGRDARVREEEIIGAPLVHWHGSPNDCDGEFFVRQTYLVVQRRWISLEESHMKCCHQPTLKPSFSDGDTILAALSDDSTAEPYEVLKMFKQRDVGFVRLRQLLRMSRFHLEAKPNELVYPDHGAYDTVKKIQDFEVIGKCLVRFYRTGESVPVPYSRNGTANLFFITHKLNLNQEGPVPFEGQSQFPTSLRQGFDPCRPVKKLRGLDLFCGSGNFGRGLEEGGAIEMRWANDLWDRAIHTYMANTPNPDTTHPFLGSIDDLLRMAIEGKFADNVPRPGDVDFISAGSPCQGFSLLTTDKTTPQQRKNQSLVAAFATAVDFYRPKYGILENVMTIIQTGNKRSEDVFSQLICAIVGLGYQTQVAIGDAWSYGAPQSRSRVFLFFAAPGFRLPASPTPSHTHPLDIRQRDLGKMSNGEHFVRRLFQPAAFKFVNAEQATSDLPRIDDAKPDCCVSFPDHRVSFGVTAATRQQIALIPTHPFAMNFVTTWDDGHGYMTSAERAKFPVEGKSRVRSTSKAWGRVHPKYLFHTVATTCAPTDARIGRQLHWDEDRPASLMEARRAQGFLDEEVLLGTLHHKWKLVGNSVARPMALALGLEFRAAWLGTLWEVPGTLASTPGEPETNGALDMLRVPEAAPAAEQPLYRQCSSVSRMSPGADETTGEASPTPASSVCQGFDARARKRPLASASLGSARKIHRKHSMRGRRGKPPAAHPVTASDSNRVSVGSGSTTPLPTRPVTAGGLTVIRLTREGSASSEG